MKHYLLFFSLLLIQSGFARTVWKAQLPIVDKSDYYNIELNQELIGAGLKYMKILDENSNETPYFIRSTDPIKEISNFESFDLMSNTTKDSLSIVIVDNKQAENLNHFCIILQQAETKKYVSLRGSNNLKQWYIVKQQTIVSAINSQLQGNTEMLIIDFPLGNYRYYEITLWNDQQSPLEILKAGKIKNSNIYGNFVAINLGKLDIKNNNKDKSTRLSFPELDYTFCINKIEFYIKNKPDYYRQAILIDSISNNRKDFYLSSNEENTLLINDFFFTPLTVVSIENQNNPPLIIDSVKLYGLCRYACLYLEAGKKYQLLLDSKEPVSTTYDIEYFRNKINADIAVLELENLNNYTTLQVSERNPTVLESPAFLWSVIIIVGLFLVFICLRMIQDMRKKQ